MSGRPEILFPLFAELKSLEGVGPKTALNYQQMHVETPRDLLFTLPHSGIDRRVRDTVDGVIGQQVVTVEVQIDGHQPPRQKGRPYRVFVSDAQISFQLVFFHARED
jgi:ATP-dependent DNA helicase RecG